MLWNHAVLAAVVTIALSAAAIVIVKHLPATYRAQALVVVDSQKIPEKFVSSTVNSDVEDRLAAISQDILSSARLKQIINDYHLYTKQRKTHTTEDIIRMMRTDIEVKLQRGWISSGRPGAFTVAYRGPDPVTVAAVANRLANLYVQENFKNREVQAEGTSQFIESQLSEAKAKLDKLESAVSRYKIQHNGELPEQQGSLLATLNRLQIELQGNQDALNRAQQTKVMLQNSLRVAEAEQSAVSRLRQAPADGAFQSSEIAIPASSVQRKSDLIRSQLEQARLRYSDQHPEVRRLQAELDAELHNEAADDAASPKAAVVPAGSVPKQIHTPAPSLELVRAQEHVADLKAQLNVADQEIRARTVDRQRILDSIADYQRRVEQLPIREQEMASLTRDYEISQQNYRSLLDKKISADISTDMEHRQKAERFSVLDPAKEPDKPAGPGRRVYAVLALGFSFLCGIAAALGRGFYQNMFLGEWELPEGVSILARVPTIVVPRSRSPRKGSQKVEPVRAIISGILLFVAICLGRVV
jgi:polysaccharide chain length determinant protein (PEP-CTERM system associated)